MTRDDIIKLASDCGLTIHGELMLGVEHFANLVVAVERDACAKVCDEWVTADDCKTAIRARGKE